MYKHLLIAIDNSDLARKALAQGLSLAKAIGARITVVSVTESWSTMAPPEVLKEPFVQEFEQAAVESAKRILDGAAAAAKEAGVDCSTLHVPDQFPAEGILEAAASTKCDLIVMASHGRRGLKKLLLGSQASEVVAQSKVPVLVCR
jgi:nucleotide-binding universal stress UspA family protein